MQVINFSFIKERNRVPFVAAASFLWTIFLAYMKQMDAQALQNGDKNPQFDIFEKLISSLQLHKWISEIILSQRTFFNSVIVDFACKAELHHCRGSLDFKQKLLFIYY